MDVTSGAMGDASTRESASPPVLRVLRRATAAQDETQLGAMVLRGEEWRVTEVSRRAEGESGVRYTCVSYSWGSERQPHPSSPRHTISRRAVPAAETVLGLLQPDALWLDAWCVPLDAVERAQCLLRLGKIYAEAEQVVVVLSAPCGPLLEQIHRTKGLDEAALAIFERDEWLTRAWTYQETVNSRKLFFVAEGSSAQPVDGQEFLNHVGHALMLYRQKHRKSGFEMHLEFPRADSLENLMADWLMGDYLQRSAYQVLSSMYRRRAERPEDFFVALLGTLSESLEPDSALGPAGAPAAERFMRACERKGDFSFIYAAAPRGERDWRPAAGEMQALFPWHTYGAGQPGVIETDHLVLEAMHRVDLGAVDGATQEMIAKSWLARRETAPPPTPETILGSLRQAGFAGTGEPLSTAGGYFFPNLPVDELDGAFVAISTGLAWTQGALGLLLRERNGAGPAYVAIGVFVGPVPKQGQSIRVSHRARP